MKNKILVLTTTKDVTSNSSCKDLLREAHCTGSEVNLTQEQTFGPIKRNVYTVHDGDSVSDDGPVAFDNRKTECREWGW